MLTPFELTNDTRTQKKIARFYILGTNGLSMVTFSRSATICMVVASAISVATTPEGTAAFADPEYVAYGSLDGYEGLPLWKQSNLVDVFGNDSALRESSLEGLPEVSKGAILGGMGEPWETTEESKALMGTTCNFEIVDLQGGEASRGDELWNKVATVVRSKKPALFVNMLFDASGTADDPHAGERNREKWARQALSTAWRGIHNLSVMTFAPMEQFGKGFRISTTMEDVAAQLPRSVNDISEYNIENEYMWDPNAMGMYGDALQRFFPGVSAATDRLFNDTTRFIQVQRELAWRILGQSPGTPLTAKAMKQANELMTKKSQGAELLHKTGFIDLTAAPGEREALAAAHDSDTTKCTPSIIGFGPSGIGLPFHVHDEVPFNLQIWGHKRWFISSGTPPRGYNPKKNSYRWLVEEYPRLTDEQRDPSVSGLYECTVRPGEAVYVPRDFYHQTMNVGVQLNLAFSCPAANREENLLQKSATSRSRYTAGGKDTIQGDPAAASRKELTKLWADAAKLFAEDPADEGVQRETATVGIAHVFSHLRRIRRAFVSLAWHGAHDLMDLGLGDFLALEYDPLDEVPSVGAGAVIRRSEELAELLEFGFVHEDRVQAASAWSQEVLAGLDGNDASSESDSAVNGTWSSGQHETAQP